MRIIAFVNKEEKYICFEKYNIVVKKFNYRQLLDLIVLYIVAINIKIFFNI